MIPIRIAIFLVVLLQGCAATNHSATEATAESPEALYQQGMRHAVADGDGKRDAGKAFELLTQASQRGHRQATYALAWMYWEGRGVESNPERAGELFLKLAAEGHADSQYMVSNMYGLGKGLPKDFALSIHWLRKAAEAGHPGAQKTLSGLAGARESTPAR